MGRVLLDSAVLIDALRGRPAGDRLRTLRRQGDEPWPCAISIEESWRGLLPREVAIAQRLMRRLRCAPLGPPERSCTKQGPSALSWIPEASAGPG